MFVFDNFIITRPIPFVRALIPFNICTFNFTGCIDVNMLMLVNMWEFDPISNWALVFLVIDSVLDSYEEQEF